MAAETTEETSAFDDRTRNQRRQGVANCYVFKSRLQEYAQKVGIHTPVYETIKEGPSHEPIFRSTVVVNGVRYDSLPGFFNRKVAEQSAAEVALIEINKSGQSAQCIPIVHETGLCKNMLQEYAQKMNYAIPSYVCTRNASGLNSYICSVEIGGIQYIGAAAKTKKEAEIKAARTALLAIKSQSETTTDYSSQYTVLPGQRKGKDQEAQKNATAKQLKPKKVNFKNKSSKKRFPRKNKQVLKPDKVEIQNPTTEDASMAISMNIAASREEPQTQLESSTFFDFQQNVNMSLETNRHCETLVQSLPDYNQDLQGQY